MKTLYLHVGPHKTGTTAIQKFMLDNQQTLFAEGLLYPKRFIRIFGHHHIRERIAQRAFTDEDIAFFKDSQCNFVVSSEDLISLNKQDFSYFKQSLPFLNIKVVFSWRRASYKLYSIWQEVIKHGGTVDFFEYYHEHLARPAMSQMLSPDLKLGMFSQVFGKENICLIDYDASANNNSLIEDFLQAVGSQINDQMTFDANNESARNVSLSVEDTETVRALNYLLKDKASGPIVRTAFQEHKESLSGDDLSYVQGLINEFATALRIGNYAIDIRAEKLMSQDYASNMLNYEPRAGSKEVKLPSTKWLLDAKAHECLLRIANKMSELM
ncbi:hypothetical protein ACFO4O_07800 [Glaciecola siphonariae]|uniref:Sulfotransferase domain-containing protein n=1 Tax=Glaciecola siphonariae TaxID=521012 RepID=A0ABV9LX80_9ALTE